MTTDPYKNISWRISGNMTTWIPGLKIPVTQPDGTIQRYVVENGGHYWKPNKWAEDAICPYPDCDLKGEHKVTHDK